MPAWTSSDRGQGAVFVDGVRHETSAGTSVIPQSAFDIRETSLDGWISTSSVLTTAQPLGLDAAHGGVARGLA